MMVPSTTSETLKHKINPSVEFAVPQAVDVLLYTPGTHTHAHLLNKSCNWAVATAFLLTLWWQVSGSSGIWLVHNEVWLLIGCFSAVEVFCNSTLHCGTHPHWLTQLTITDYAVNLWFTISSYINGKSVYCMCTLNFPAALPPRPVSLFGKVLNWKKFV